MVPILGSRNPSIQQPGKSGNLRSPLGGWYWALLKWGWGKTSPVFDVWLEQIWPVQDFKAGTLWQTHDLLLKIAIVIVYLPFTPKNGDVPSFLVCLPEDQRPMLGFVRLVAAICWIQVAQ